MEMVYMYVLDGKRCSFLIITQFADLVNTYVLGRYISCDVRAEY